MSKQKRIWYPKATYHIMCRGNRRSDLFRDDEDYQVYLSILNQAKEKYNYILYTYCMMTNHIHLQLQTEEDEIWKIMRLINVLYAKYFNSKYNYIGHLFQGRYRSEIIEEDSYNLTTSRYIHLNPVRAAMVDVPKDYKWSSYNIYMGNTKSDLVDEEEILSYFNNNSRELYKNYVESRLINKKLDKKIKQKMEVE